MKKDTNSNARSNNDCIAVTLTWKKMNAAGVTAEITPTDDLLLYLPRMSYEQEERLGKIWATLHDDLLDIDIHPATVETTIAAAGKTLQKETYARTIANLL